MSLKLQSRQNKCKTIVSVRWVLTLLTLVPIALQAGCGSFAHIDWDYIIPNDYHGFLAIHYECTGGQPLAIKDGKIRIEFNDNGTLCIKDKFLPSIGQDFVHNKDGQPVTIYELAQDERTYVFHAEGVRGIGRYGVDYGTFEIFWTGIKKDLTLEGLDDFLESRFGIPKFKVNSTPSQP